MRLSAVKLESMVGAAHPTVAPGPGGEPSLAQSVSPHPHAEHGDGVARQRRAQFVFSLRPLRLCGEKVVV
ncbi:MAG: hypothetical protein ABFR97_06950 [Thermodesulfobacteriota bacterium]